MAAAILLGGLVASAQPTQLPLSPVKAAGQSVTAAYEGWFRASDGAVYLLVGYFNRNTEQILDIPVGPNNRIEPGGPDRGQPTHFMPRRHYGVFTIPVPGDLGDEKVTWTIVANGQVTSIPMGLDPLWELQPYLDAAQGNTPPVLRFARDDPGQQGPPLRIVEAREARVGEPLALVLWASDDGVVDPDRRPFPGAPVRVRWSKFRGPGAVTFGEERPEVDEATGETTTTATFDAPGDYVLRAQGNDVSRFGFQCCWTNAHVAVTVVP